MEIYLKKLVRKRFGGPLLAKQRGEHAFYSVRALERLAKASLLIGRAKRETRAAVKAERLEKAQVWCLAGLEQLWCAETAADAARRSELDDLARTKSRFNSLLGACERMAGGCPSQSAGLTLAAL